MCSIRDRATKKAMQQSAVIVSASATADAFGSSASGTPTNSAPIPCRLVNTSARPRDIVVGDKPAVRSEWYIIFPLGTNAQPTDTVQIDGQSFEIIDTDKGAAGKSCLTAFCKKQS